MHVLNCFDIVASLSHLPCIDRDLLLSTQTRFGPEPDLGQSTRAVPYCVEIFRPLYGYGYRVPITILALYSGQLYAVYGMALLDNAIFFFGNVHRQLSSRRRKLVLLSAQLNSSQADQPNSLAWLVGKVGGPVFVPSRPCLCVPLRPHLRVPLMASSSRAPHGLVFTCPLQLHLHAPPHSLVVACPLQLCLHMPSSRVVYGCR
jgi:hypothetical protein